MECMRRVVRGRNVVLAGLAVVASLTIAVAPASARPGDDGPGRGKADVFAPNAHPFGLTYAEWSAEWWTWALRNGDASFSDTTGANCGQGQTGGRVWFLAGSFSHVPVERTCTVTDDVALLFPIVNSAYAAFPTDLANERTEEFVRGIAEANFGPRDTVVPTLRASIDGVDVPDLGERFVSSVLFDVDGIQAGNPFGATETVDPVADVGYYVMVKKLHRGAHTIHFEGTSLTASPNVTVHLNVVHH